MVRSIAVVAAVVLGLSLPPASVCAADLSITAYGAVAGDGASDLTAFQAAFAAAQPGDRVLVPAGTFDISGAIIPKTGVALVGAGRDTTTIRRLSSGSDAPMIDLNDRSNVTLTGFTLDGQSTPKATQGVVAANGSRVTITGIRVQNLVANAAFGPHGIYAASEVHHSTFSDNAFLNIGVNSEWGAGIRAGESSHLAIHDNTIQNTGRGGILLAATTDATILNNTVTGSGSHADAPALGIEVWGGSHRAIIEDNHIDHWLSVDQSSRVAVRRNTITDNWTNPDQIESIGLELANAASDVVFTDNVVDNAQHIGVSMSNVGDRTRVLIAHNQIRNMQTFGMQIQADGDGATSRLVLFDNLVTTGDDDESIYGPEGAGIRFNADHGAIADVLVLDNTITDNAGPAFNRQPSSGAGTSGFRFVSNTVTGNQDNTVPPNASYATADPTVAIAAPAAAIVGEAVSFEVIFTAAGVAADPDAVLWDFDEGLPETGAAQTHAFTKPGDYRITVVAWAADGRAALAQHTITITAPEPTALAPFSLTPFLLARLRP